MRILILRGGALGDFVLTLPAIGLLRRRWPEGRIELAGNARAARLGLGRGGLDAVHSADEACWSRLGSGSLSPEEPIGRRLRSFDLAVSYWPDPDGAVADDFHRLGFAAPGPGRPPERTAVFHPAQPALAPASAHFCAALAPLGLRPAPHELLPRVFPGDGDRAAVQLLLPDGGAPLVAWHPGSGSPRKDWPAARWLEVIRTAEPLRGTRLVVLLGEAEDSWWDASGAPARLPPGTVCLRALPPRHLAAVAERCRVFLGHDTGPAHVAAAAGCPCVLVFGPTDPAMWAPPHPWVRVARRGERTEAVTVPDALGALGELWARGRATW
jgi:heptosyltransferase-2